MLVCVGTQCVPSVAARVVAKIYRPFFIYNIFVISPGNVFGRRFTLFRTAFALISRFSPRSRQLSRVSLRDTRGFRPCVFKINSLTSGKKCVERVSFPVPY